MRAFLALELDQTIRDAYAQLYAAGRAALPRLSWVSPENLHLTLRFLGELDAGLEPRLFDALEREAKGLEPFLAIVGEPGAFGSRQHPRALWFGFAGGERLSRLAHAVERAVRAIGLPNETRPFRSHLTVARNRRGERVDDWLEIAQGCKLSGLSQNVERVTLLSSLLQRGRSPQYSPLWRLSLIHDES
ncbi:MAG: RNA 2',3'-cyclic phosphodiesterase [Planctomycetes bacterium]|nr:RNA 2',3'-cyclic phosphodiesterase [Planctomycetota bacterium]